MVKTIHLQDPFKQHSLVEVKTWLLPFELSQVKKRLSLISSNSGNSSEFYCLFSPLHVKLTYTHKAYKPIKASQCVVWRVQCLYLIKLCKAMAGHAVPCPAAPNQLWAAPSPSLDSFLQLSVTLLVEIQTGMMHLKEKVYFLLLQTAIYVNKSHKVKDWRLCEDCALFLVQPL